MFSRFRNRLSHLNEPPEPPPAPPSIISRDLRIVGDIHSDGELQIDGVVEGDVRAGTLLVGDTADILGDVIAETVHVHGRLSGDISARTVGLGETARVTGDILHEDISIQMGAYLEGHCRRAHETAHPAQPAAAVAQSGQSGAVQSAPAQSAPAQSGPARLAADIENIEDIEDAEAPARRQAGGS